VQAKASISVVLIEKKALVACKEKFFYGKRLYKKKTSSYKRKDQINGTLNFHSIHKDTDKTKTKFHVQKKVNDKQMYIISFYESFIS
jgi:flavin-dependent dehydrogenase